MITSVAKEKNLGGKGVEQEKRKFNSSINLTLPLT